MSSAEKPQQFITQLHSLKRGEDGNMVSRDITGEVNYPESPIKKFLLGQPDSGRAAMYAVIPNPETPSSFTVFVEDGTVTAETENAQKIGHVFFRPLGPVTPDRPFPVGEIREGETLVVKVEKFNDAKVIPIELSQIDLESAAD